jgi:hypothetical protein
VKGGSGIKKLGYVIFNLSDHAGYDNQMEGLLIQQQKKVTSQNCPFQNHERILQSISENQVTAASLRTLPCF